MKFSFEKKFVYDWVGGNEWLFKAINSLNGNPTYDSFMVFISHLGEHTNFPYYATAFIAFALLDFVFKKIGKKAGAFQSLKSWIAVLCVFTACTIIDDYIVKSLKEYFAYPRPYVALGPQDVHTLGEIQAGNGNRAFPSGHAAFITVVIGSLWPMLSGKGPWIGFGLVFLVCWSRIAMGVHFPSDVIAGALLSFILVLMVRFVIYSLFAKLLKWKC